jgi:hypothetical protein
VRRLWEKVVFRESCADNLPLVPIMVETYQAFLDAKRVRVPAVGIDVESIHLLDALKPFQRAIVQWALRRGRAAIFADCGLGKTPMQLEWARHVSRETDRPVLILAPLAVAQQTAREGEKFGIPVTVCRTGADVRAGLNVTNYEMLPHFDPAVLGGIVLDECFAPDTAIDVISIDGQPSTAYIKDVRAGDSILNAQGLDTVADVHRRVVPFAVRVCIAGNEPITCSPNHPFFTRRGWVGAMGLVAGDEIMATAEAVRMVRDGVSSSLCAGSEEAILQSILLSEMADVSTGDTGAGACASSGGEARAVEVGMVQGAIAGGAGADRPHPSTEPDERPSRARESLPHVESDAAQTFRAWGQWPWLDRSTTDVLGCTRRTLASGIQYLVGATDSWLSDALQDRHRRAATENRNRGGWRVPLEPESGRRQEGCDAPFARVDSLEILEPGHPELERWRSTDGHVYFYDLGATRHPSYSIGGRLVHNSSILKAFDGTTRKAITTFASGLQFRLACTATPAPNDLIELTNHAEFLSIMTGKEIIALYFTNDGNTTHNWRLKGHARQDFWRWMAQWSVAVRTPSDLGFSDDGYILPACTHHQIEVSSTDTGGRLFVTEAQTMDERRAARRASLPERVAAAAAVVAAQPDEPWIVWCNLNAESQALVKAIPGAVEITGSDTTEHKESAILGFLSGAVRVVVSKPSILGFGLNLQHCARMVFVGLSDSYEQLYQATRRCWRFGQVRPVDVYLVTSDAEGAVVRNIQRKEAQAEEMFRSIVAEMAGLSLGRAERHEMTYQEREATGDGWRLLLGDSAVRLKDIESESVGLTVTSPPFPGMYAYTNSAHDIGNTSGIQEMIDHFAFLVPELYRVTMPGRMCCVHLVQLTAMKSREGWIGLKDYRGAVIELFARHGWPYAGEVTIDKNPQIQATRNKERGLLFKSLATDSSLMRMALADYLLYFRKPGENPQPIRAGVSDKYNEGGGWITEEEWIEWAAPVWYRHTAGYPGGIRETDVLNVAQARETDDERHLCPLQRGVIERAVKLWSAPGDLVLDPFNGIGSTGREALRLNRRYVGIELKESYYQTALGVLREAERLGVSQSLFAEVG